ncbi:peptide MFS transporter [Antarcticibacterium arcticum]|uniref:Peptide MFS transporter n=1 Tax=Antarcticibacterium arcticum TaxID=2585771 RepID=A0A5B8YNH9_9FLAO|nr:peptide MFS transporter [Antarcticibacterium arcticum]QED38193.1 peptide MFS transporter [Antarcticibacterium arcticum]
MAATAETNNDFFKSNVIGHPAGLFVLFFTEMWERFSYYGMRALLVLFLTSSLFDEGWAWPREQALALYGTYTSLVYLTPILGGYIADRYMGYRNAVVLGAFIMTIGHACMALDTPFALYLGLFFLVAGNGFFKPNMTSIISHLYVNHPEKKDGAYTIFYMGVNAGAFLGILLCGYVGEQIGWHWGFGLAGIFMFFGMLQFYFAQNIFGEVGKKPLKENKEVVFEDKNDKLNPFTVIDKILIVVSSVIGLVWIINDPMSKIGNTNILDFSVAGMDGSNFMILFALILFIFLLVTRILRYSEVVRDKMIAISIFAFFTVFFWAAFEQAGGSMTIFAADYTDRVLAGNSANIFRVVNTLITIIPLAIITWVLHKLFQQTFKNYALSNIFLGISFVIVWVIVGFMLYNQYLQENPEVPASWFSVLNSLFIIIFAPLFSKLWESKYNPSVAVKYGMGLILLGAGFLSLAYGASGIPTGAKVAAVSMIWLVFAYLFHTLGELCLSPVGLSYLSKLVPGRMIAFMFGIWYLAIAIGNKLAGTTGGMIDSITEEHSLSFFFMLFFFIPAGAGVLIILMRPLLRRLMHGIH